MTTKASRYNVPYTTAFDSTGIVAPEAQLFFYLTGTSTPANTYSDAGLTTPNANPVQANGAGLFPSIFLIPSQLYKVVLEDVNGDEIWTADPVAGGPSSATTVFSFATTTALLNAFGSQFVLPDGTIAATAGNTAEGDGYGAQFFYKASDTTSADNGTTIRVDGANRRWYALQNFNYDSIQYVGDGSWRAGDIGAQINAAYSALPASGGKIIINPKVGGGKYDYSTPIVLATSGKYVVLEGIAPGGASSAEGCCLNYTPVTATAAITLDYATVVVGPPSSAGGLRNITLVNNNNNTSGGSGSLATGILVGVANGGDWDATYDRVMIQGFGIGYSNLNNTAVTQDWIAPVFICNDTAMTIAGATMKFFGGQAAANGRVFLQPSGTHQCEVYFIGVTFFDNFHNPVFDCNSSTTKADLNFNDCHFENSPSLHGHYISGAVNVTMIGGLMEDDNSTGTNDWMIQTGNFSLVTMLGTKVASNRTLTAVVDMTNEVRAIVMPVLLSPSNITPVAGAFAAEATVMPLTPYGTTPSPWNIRGALTLQDIPTFAGANSTGAGATAVGSNCPAVTPTTVYKWITVKLADGSTGYIPAWK